MSLPTASFSALLALALAPILAPLLVPSLLPQPDEPAAPRTIAAAIDALERTPRRPAAAPVPVAIPAPLVPAIRFDYVSPRDTIDGEPIRDPALIDRIERLAQSLRERLAAIPAVAAEAQTEPRRGVVYLTLAGASEHDGTVEYGAFAHPLAALAFGCARDPAFADGECAPIVAAPPVAVLPAVAIELPGLACTPLGIALGAPSYEPERCRVTD
ncbi:MAG: hypothetical protein AB7G13_35270 [Lautropia sp.]